MGARTQLQRMGTVRLIHEELSRSVIGAFYRVYNSLGFGFLEQIYLNALERELVSRGHRVAREVGVQVFYQGEVVGNHRVDMIVDAMLVVEVKSTLELHRSAPRQLFAYLRSTRLEVGLLLHFGPKATFTRLICPNIPKNPTPDSQNDPQITREQSAQSV